MRGQPGHAFPRERKRQKAHARPEKQQGKCWQRCGGFRIDRRISKEPTESSGTAGLSLRLFLKWRFIQNILFFRKFDELQLGFQQVFLCIFGFRNVCMGKGIIHFGREKIADKANHQCDNHPQRW